MTTEIDGKNLSRVLRELTRPFLDEEVEWRVDRTTAANNGRPPRAYLLAYLTLRGVQQRLDSAVGAHNWSNQTQVYPTACHVGIGILIRKEWVWKWDGAGQRSMHGDQADLHQGKAAVSDAMKRAAVQWGMGRHLYDLPDTWVDVSPNYPKGVPKCRVVYVSDRRRNIRGYCVAPSIRELQADLLGVEDLVRDIADPLKRRHARVEVVRTKMGWAHPQQDPQSLILDALEAASAIPAPGSTPALPNWERPGVRSLRALSPDALKIASRRLSDWYSNGELIDQIGAYGKWRTAQAQATYEVPGESPTPTSHAKDPRNGGPKPWGRD